MSDTTYKLVNAPAGYPGHVYEYAGTRRVLEHHLVWWQTTGQIVPEGFELHHENRIRKDNRFSNLKLLSKAEHHRLHHGTPELITVECAYCKTDLVRTLRDYKAKKKTGQKLFFCSKSHAARHQNKSVKGKIKHGTSSGYNVYGCRCDLCRNYAHRRYLRSRG